MCTVLLPPGDNPIAVNKYIISYHNITSAATCFGLNNHHQGACYLCFAKVIIVEE